MSDRDIFCATECRDCWTLPNDNDEVVTRDDDPVYATLHFYYNNPDSMARMRRCLAADDMMIVLSEFDTWLRGLIKHSDRKDIETLAEVRDRLWIIAEENNIDIWGE